MNTPYTSDEAALNEDALIDAALAVLETAPLSTHLAEAAAMSEAGHTPLLRASPTLDALAASRRPTAGTVCEHCPNSVWFASPTELKCYCRVMFLVTWSSQAPNQITHCDGTFLGQADETPRG
mgnify:FL=1